MKTRLIFRTAILVLSLVLTADLSAQYAYSDPFSLALGQDAESPQVTELVSNYHMEKANDAHYLSKEGVELILKEGKLTEVRFYHSSPAFGSFTSVLPHALKFGMTSSEVKALLGKPTVAYSSSGYSEFEKDGKVISCWVEGGKLTQVSISKK